jgi:hypothetical protein
VPHVRGHDADAAGHRPAAHLLGQGPAGGVVAATGRDQGLQEVADPLQQRIVVGLAEGETLVGQRLDVVPSSGEICVVAQEEERFDRGCHRAAFATVAYRPPQRLPAAADAVEVAAGDSGTDDAGGARLGVQPIDRGIQLPEGRLGQPGRLAEGASED